MFCLLENESAAWRWELRRREDHAVLAKSSDEFGSMEEAREAVARIQAEIGNAPIEDEFPRPHPAQ